MTSSGSHSWIQGRTKATRRWAGSSSSALHHCLSDSGLYQTEQRKCSWDLTCVNTPPSPWSWPLAKIGRRPDLVGPSARWPWWKQSRDVEQREREKNVLSYKEQSLGWFILLILVIYPGMPVTHNGCQQLCRNSECLSWTYNPLVTSSLFPNVQSFPGNAFLVVLLVLCKRTF